MDVRIEDIKEKKLLGKHLRMSLTCNKTPELWRSFMMQRGQIKNNLNGDLISMQVYDPDLDFRDFNPAVEFEKWAAGFAISIR